jgi:hypothetical protein
MHLWNVGKRLPDYTAQHPRRHSSSYVRYLCIKHKKLLIQQSLTVPKDCTSEVSKEMSFTYYRWLSLYAGGYVPANRRVHRKRVKRETYKMPVDFLSNTQWEALICSPRRQNGWASQWNCARNSVGLRGSFYRARGYDIDAHNTEIKLGICENADSERAYNDSHLYCTCIK